MERKLNKLEKHWPAIQLSIIHWWLFATLTLIASAWLLMREIKSLKQDNAEMVQTIGNYKRNLAEIEKQMGSGKVILELGKGMDE